MVPVDMPNENWPAWLDTPNGDGALPELLPKAPPPEGSQASIKACPCTVESVEKRVQSLAVNITVMPFLLRGRLHLVGWCFCRKRGPQCCLWPLPPQTRQRLTLPASQKRPLWGPPAPPNAEAALPEKALLVWAPAAHGKHLIVPTVAATACRQHQSMR